MHSGGTGRFRRFNSGAAAASSNYRLLLLDTITVSAPAPARVSATKASKGTATPRSYGSGARILSIDALDLAFSPRRWAFAEAEAQRIADHWRARVARQPQLYNGRVLVLARHTIAATPRGTTLSGEYIETDYASFLAWRDFGFPASNACNGFSMAALRGADGAFLLGEMSPHTASAGAIFQALARAGVARVIALPQPDWSKSPVASVSRPNSGNPKKWKP